jgi:hypothetical protein
LITVGLSRGIAYFQGTEGLTLADVLYDCDLTLQELPSRTLTRQ